MSYDGQAAIELEALAESVGDSTVTLDRGGSYRYSILSDTGRPLQLDFSPLFPDILADLKSGTPTAVIAHRFHATVASAVVDVCLRLSRASGLERVVLSGGVFQNRLLSEMVYTALANQGLQVFTHRLSPPNDGCIALGQAAVAGWKIKEKQTLCA